VRELKLVLRKNLYTEKEREILGTERVRERERDGPSDRFT
jgi:hypothetical protein